MTGEELNDILEHVALVFAGSRNVAADAGEDLSALECAEGAGYFLLDLHHAKILLGQVVGEGDLEIIKESQGGLVMKRQANEKVLGFRLLAASAERRAGRRSDGIGGAALTQKSLIALGEGSP